MRIAIVGSGISGLVAAHLLHRDHDITVLEAEGRIGGHTHTVPVSRGQRTLPVDTGFIVFNEQNYPCFVRLLRRLGVAWQDTDMSFSVRVDASGLEWNGTSFNTIFAQRGNLLRWSFLRMLRDIQRFHCDAPRLLDSDAEDDLSVQAYADTRRLGRELLEHYLVPLGASLWSCPPGTFLSFPMRFVVEFLHNHNMLQAGGRPVWKVIRGGSCRYLEPLTRGFQDRIITGRRVAGVRRSSGAAHLSFACGAPEEAFDEVVIACHADQALAILRDPSAVEAELLGAFPYQRNEAVLHTDTRALPRCRRAWASWNYRVRRGTGTAGAVTYDMNRLQGLDTDDVHCVTLNGDDEIDRSRILRRMTYDHPVYTSRRRQAQARHRELIRSRRTSFCGAYWGHGFHEDGVRSALAVAGAYGKEL
jgi:predicted NAD/FAD-binding protein